MKADIEMMKRGTEAAELEIMLLMKRNELMLNSKQQTNEEREQEIREKEDMKNQKHVADDQVKALINLVENISKERDDLTDEIVELRERLAAVDKDRALKLRKKLSKYNNDETATPHASKQEIEAGLSSSETEGDLSATNVRAVKSLPKKKSPRQAAEHIAVADRMREALKLYPHRHNLKRFEKCFNGKQAVDWLQQEGTVKTRNDAIALCAKMLTADCFSVLPGKENVFTDDASSIFSFARKIGRF